MSSHTNQIKDYPDGARVEAIREIPLSSPSQNYFADPLPRGTKGKIAGHTDDGRAWVNFEDCGHNGMGHTFDEPEHFIRVITEQPSTTQASDTATGDDTERLHCLDCNRLANTKCVEQGHRVAASESERLEAASTPPSLIDAAKNVERWWLQLDKSAHGFYGAPGCIFDLRWAIEDYGGRKSAPRAGERDEWEYRETRYGAEARAGQFVIRLHWTGLADIGDTRATIRKIVTDHNQHATLVEQRDRLLRLLRPVTSPTACYCAVMKDEKCWHCEARELITTIEQSV